jgi:GT2 family glycosyltransferase
VTEASDSALHPVRAVLVNYHTYDLVATCVRALQASTLAPAEIVVVDNECDPKRLAALQSSMPEVRTIANERNEGYARACNQGAHDATTDFVLFINPDVTVDTECLRRCVDAAGSVPEIAIVTCRLIRPDGRLDHACHRGLPTPSASLAYALRLHRLFPRVHRLSQYTMSWLDLKTDHDVEACSGAFMLVQRATLEQVGGWDEHYWFYGEDLDLCVRIAKVGRRVRYIGTATATHIKGAASHLHSRPARLEPGDQAHVRRLQAAIIDSHSLFFQTHLEPTTARPVAAAIRAMFVTQRLRLRVATRLDSVRNR